MINIDSIRRSDLEQIFEKSFPYSSIEKIKTNNFVVRKSIFTASYIELIKNGEEKTLLIKKQKPVNFFINKILPASLFLFGIIPMIIFEIVQAKKQKKFKRNVIEILSNNLTVTEIFEDIDGTVMVLK